jgi:carbon starvation protein CstA
MVAISEISKSLLGKAGIVLVGFGVIALPISTGDTAFRSARLTIADAVGIEQKSFKNRILVSAPLFLVAGFMSQLGFTTLWRYVAFTNQILATFTLWMCTYFLIKNKKNMLVTGLPAAFMTGVMTCYILMAPEGLRMTGSIPYYLGVIAAIVSLVVVINKNKVSKNTGYLKKA